MNRPPSEAVIVLHIGGSQFYRWVPPACLLTDGAAWLIIGEGAMEVDWCFTW